MAYNRAEKSDSPMKRRGGRRRKKVCVFCGKENNEDQIDNKKDPHIDILQPSGMFQNKQDGEDHKGYKNTR